MQWIVYPALERPKVIHARMYEDDVVSVTADMNSEASRLDTTVSTATWTTETGNISIGNKALSNNIATAQFTAPDIGTSWVKVVLTMDDGQKFSQLWTIKVINPTPIFSTNRSISGLSFLERESRLAVARYDPTSIIGTNPPTAWDDVNGNSAFDLNVPVGVGANLSTLDTNLAFFPNSTTGDNFSTLNAVANRITGDLTIIAHVSLFTWTPGAIKTILVKWNPLDKAYFLAIDTDGTIRLSWSDTGTNTRIARSTVPTGFAAGTIHWIRGTMDVDNGAGDAITQFFVSDDPITTDPLAVTWSKLGDDASFGSATSIHVSNEPVYVGEDFTTARGALTGTLSRVVVIASTDPTASPAIDFNPSKAGSGIIIDASTWVADTGETWTVEGQAFINNTGHTGLIDRGAVGLRTSAGIDIASPVTMYIVGKTLLAAPAADQAWIDARSDPNKRMIIFTQEGNSDKYSLSQGTSAISLTEPYDLNLHVITAQFNADGTTKLTISGVGSITGDAGSNNLDFGSILMAFDEASTMPGLFFELLVFRPPHNESEVAQFQTDLANKYEL